MRSHARPWASEEPAQQDQDRCAHCAGLGATARQRKSDSRLKVARVSGRVHGTVSLVPRTALRGELVG